MNDPLNTRDADLPAALLWRYGVLAVPLAFAGLPLYVHVPDLYINIYGLSFSYVGG